MNIFFHPDNDEFAASAAEYAFIWESEGEKIVEVIESVSGLKFAEDLINAIVIESRSHSHPLILRASLPEWKKKATLVHELCHRLIKGNRSLKEKQDTLQNHKEIDLILFDIWKELYGEDFAKQAVESEHTPEHYKQAWEWALQFDESERTKKFKEMADSWTK